MMKAYTEKEILSLGFRGCGNVLSDGKREAYCVVSGCGQCSYCEAEDNGGNCLNADVTYYVRED